MVQRKVQQKRQERLIIAIGVGIIAASIVTTLWFSGVFGSSKPAPQYQNITFTDAVVKCETHIRGTYEGRLRVLMLDDHSSRFEQKSYLYRLFFKAEMTNGKSESSVGDFFINCYVDADKGRIATFETYEQQESQTEAIRRDDGGLFGWPLKK